MWNWNSEISDFISKFFMIAKKFQTLVFQSKNTFWTLKLTLEGTGDVLESIGDALQSLMENNERLATGLSSSKLSTLSISIPKNLTLKFKILRNSENFFELWNEIQRLQTPKLWNCKSQNFDNEEISNCFTSNSVLTFEVAAVGTDKIGIYANQAAAEIARIIETAAGSANPITASAPAAAAVSVSTVFIRS